MVDLPEGLGVKPPFNRFDPGLTRLKHFTTSDKLMSRPRLKMLTNRPLVGNVFEDIELQLVKLFRVCYHIESNVHNRIRISVTRMKESPTTLHCALLFAFLLLNRTAVDIYQCVSQFMIEK